MHGSKTVAAGEKHVRTSEEPIIAELETVINQVVGVSIEVDRRRRKGGGLFTASFKAGVELMNKEEGEIEANRRRRSRRRERRCWTFFAALKASSKSATLPSIRPFSDFTIQYQ